MCCDMQHFKNLIEKVKAQRTVIRLVVLLILMKFAFIYCFPLVYSLFHQLP